MAFASFAFTGFSNGGETERFLLRDVVALDDGFVAHGVASWDGADGGRVFEAALVELDADLRPRRWSRLPPFPPVAESPWKEGDAVMTAFDDGVVHIASKSGRGLLLDVRSGQVLERYAGDGSPASVARAPSGVCLAVLGVPSERDRFVDCRQRVKGTSTGAALPSAWTTLTPNDSPLRRSGLHAPWVHQLVALPDERWLMGVATNGRTKSAYPSKSIGFRYAITDADGEELHVLDHGAADPTLHVYDSADATLFPSDRHPFYPVRYSAETGELVHKLLKALLFFRLDGSLAQHIDLSQRGLTGLKKFELATVSPTGVALFHRRADNAAFTASLASPDERAPNLVAGLKAYRKGLKAAPEGVPVSGDLIRVIPS